MRSLAVTLVLMLMSCSGGQKAEAEAPAEEITESKPMEHEHGGAHHHDPAAHKHDHMQHRFEDAEQWAKVFDNPERDAWQKPKEVVKHMAIAPGSVVADVGAGTGYFMPYLSQAVGAEGKVLALDIEPNLVEHMQKRATEAGFENVETRVIATDDPQIEAGSADRILIVDTWHHISGREAYSKKLAEALSETGAVYIVDFTIETERGPKGHKLAPETVMKELESAGLKASIVEETLPDQYIVKATR